MPISTIDGVAWSSLSSFGGVAKASIASVNGVTAAETYTLQQSQGTSAASTANLGQDTTTDRRGVAYSFTANANYSLSRIYILGQKQGTGGTANITAKIYTDNAGAPGTLLNTSETTVVGSAFPASWDLVAFNWASGNRPSLSNGTRYWVVLQASAISAANFVNLRFQSSGTEAVDFTDIASPSTGDWQPLDSSAAGALYLYKSP